jgi:hypothetical protein
MDVTAEFGNERIVDPPYDHTAVPILDNDGFGGIDTEVTDGVIPGANVTDALSTPEIPGNENTPCGNVIMWPQGYRVSADADWNVYV